MANDTGAANPELWSSILEQALRKATVFREFCSFKEEAGLTYGDAINRPYSSDISVDTYVAGSASTAQDITITNSQLLINKFDIINIYVDDTQKLQSRYDLAAHYIEKMKKALAEDMDTQALLEIRNAVADVDANDISGGTAGTAFTPTNSNIIDVYTYADKYLTSQNATDRPRFSILSPGVFQKLLTYVGGKDTVFGDQVTQYGYPSKGSFNDFRIYRSNQLPFSKVWTPADNPSNAATITIDSVVFTFVSSIGTTAGNVLIGGSTALTLDNLVALINNGGLTSDAGVSNVSLALADRRKVRKWYAVDGTTYVRVYVGGKSSDVTCATSEVLDLWSDATVHQFFGEVGCVDMVVQKNVNVKSAEQTSNSLLGSTYLTNSVFGVKTFYEGTYRMVNVRVSSTYA
jgi:hypothetical protein